MTGVAFLDRDGTVIELVHHLNDPADVALIPGAGRAIADMRAAGWRVVIITNQSVIGRGKLTEAGLCEIHDEMRRQLALHGADVDGIYFCPLAPTIKDPTVIEDAMRKPGPGMLLAASAEMQIDLGASWMVGDTVSDMLAGRHAGCRTVLVRTGYGDKYAHGDTAVDHDVADLSAAAAVIMRSKAQA